MLLLSLCSGIDDNVVDVVLVAVAVVFVCYGSITIDHISCRFCWV